MIGSATLTIQLWLCDLRWWFFCRFERWYREASVKSRDTIAHFNAQVLGDEFDNGRAVIWLRTNLRCNPCWSAGHLYLGELAFGVRDYHLAFTCSQAVMALSNASQSVKHKAQLLLGQTYLALGDAKSACEVLRALVEFPELIPFAQEDLAAALVQIGEKQEALRILSSVPSDKLTQHGHSAKEWLTRGFAEYPTSD